MTAAGDDATKLAEVFEVRGLRLPPSVPPIYSQPIADLLGALLLRPDGTDDPELRTIDWAQALIDDSSWPLLPNLVPLMVVDEVSFACVVASDVDGEPLPGEGAIVRWHLELESEAFQAAVLDLDSLLYGLSVVEELASREEGLRRVLDEIGPAYEETYIAPGERPRDFVVRPVRVACQNVIVGLAAFAQEPSFDGLSVVAWQTCEVPHIATHEANRALAVLTLCDAFQNGGTMEIRFDRLAKLRMKHTTGRPEIPYRGHPEQRVPASLRRFGRTVGVLLGGEDEGAITPTEARALFMAITPMPSDLRQRFVDATDTHGLSPERLCYTLLKPIWRDIELDYLLATSPRVRSILQGGAPWTDRPSRQAESEVCRAAATTGMLYRRLNSTDAAGADGQARVFEDRRQGVEWTVNPDVGSVTFRHLVRDVPLPWASRNAVPTDGQLTVFPRSMLSAASVNAVAEAGAQGLVALVVPNGSDLTAVPDGVLVLTCPDRLADIDRSIEDRLLSARTARG